MPIDTLTATDSFHDFEYYKRTPKEETNTHIQTNRQTDRYIQKYRYCCGDGPEGGVLVDPVLAHPLTFLKPARVRAVDLKTIYLVMAKLIA